jgi:glutaredoxin
MLSDDQIKRLVELRKEEMVLISRKTDCERTDNLDNEARIEIERINIRLKEIEEESDKIKDLPKPITRDQLARELEVSNRTEDEIIEEHTNRIHTKRLDIEEQIREYVDENNLT